MEFGVRTWIVYQLYKTHVSWPGLLRSNVHTVSTVPYQLCHGVIIQILFEFYFNILIFCLINFVWLARLLLVKKCRCKNKLPILFSTVSIFLLPWTHDFQLLYIPERIRTSMWWPDSSTREQSHLIYVYQTHCSTKLCEKVTGHSL